jgi:hypothetical protein
MAGFFQINKEQIDYRIVGWSQKLNYDWVNGIFGEFAVLYPGKYTVLL